MHIATFSNESLCANCDHIEKLLKLEALSFRDSEISDNDVIYWISYVSNLKSLDISNTTVSNFALIYIRIILNLEHLDIHGCNGISDEGLRLISQMSKLTSLNIYGCESITSNGLTHLTGLSSLKHLCFTNRSNELLTLANNFKQCISLEFDSEHMKDTDLIVMTNTMTRLTGLIIHHCDDLTDEGFRFLDNLRDLVELQLSWCDRLTAVTLSKISNLSKLQKLLLFFDFAVVTDYRNCLI